MAKPCQLTGPQLRTATGLDADQARGARREKNS